MDGYVGLAETEGERAGSHPMSKDRMMSVDATLKAALRRDRLVVVATLLAVIALAWGYLLAGSGMSMTTVDMTRLSQRATPSAIGGQVSGRSGTPTTDGRGPRQDS